MDDNISMVGGAVTVETGVRKTSLEDYTWNSLIHYMEREIPGLYGSPICCSSNVASFTIRSERSRYDLKKELEEVVAIEKDALIPYKLGLVLRDWKGFRDVTCYGYDVRQSDIIGSVDYDKKKSDNGGIPIEKIYDAALANCVPIDIHSDTYRQMLPTILIATTTPEKPDFVFIKALLSKSIDRENGFAHYISSNERVTRVFLESLNTASDKIREVA